MEIILKSAKSSIRSVLVPLILISGLLFYIWNIARESFHEKAYKILINQGLTNLRKQEFLFKKSVDEKEREEFFPQKQAISTIDDIKSNEHIFFPSFIDEEKLQSWFQRSSLPVEIAPTTPTSCRETSSVKSSESLLQLRSLKNYTCVVNELNEVFLKRGLKASRIRTDEIYDCRTQVIREKTPNELNLSFDSYKSKNSINNNSKDAVKPEMIQEKNSELTTHDTPEIGFPIARKLQQPYKRVSFLDSYKFCNDIYDEDARKAEVDQKKMTCSKMLNHRDTKISAKDSKIFQQMSKNCIPQNFCESCNNTIKDISEDSQKYEAIQEKITENKLIVLDDQKPDEKFSEKLPESFRNCFVQNSYKQFSDVLETEKSSWINRITQEKKSGKDIKRLTSRHIFSTESKRTKNIHQPNENSSTQDIYDEYRKIRKTNETKPKQIFANESFDQNTSIKTEKIAQKFYQSYKDFSSQVSFKDFKFVDESRAKLQQNEIIEEKNLVCKPFLSYTDIHLQDNHNKLNRLSSEEENEIYFYEDVVVKPYCTHSLSKPKELSNFSLKSNVGSSENLLKFETSTNNADDEKPFKDSKKNVIKSTWFDEDGDDTHNKLEVKKSKRETPLSEENSTWYLPFENYFDEESSQLEYSEDFLELSNNELESNLNSASVRRSSVIRDDAKLLSGKEAKIDDFSACFKEFTKKTESYFRRLYMKRRKLTSKISVSKLCSKFNDS